ncbi:MAG: hypothetical protein C0407_03805 [Desulfobacca sp.]|nr:hypothetical protein [Desulfobacca sp.]
MQEEANKYPQTSPLLPNGIDVHTQRLLTDTLPLVGQAVQNRPLLQSLKSAQTPEEIFTVIHSWGREEWSGVFR